MIVKEEKVTRESGILLAISSLPSRYGIGSFSKEAYRFVDFLKKAGQKKWQLLPLGPTSFGDSPYQSFSTFAGNPYFIDLEVLIGWGLLTYEECNAFDFGDQEEKVDYEKMYHSRFAALHLAYERFDTEGNQEYEHFIESNAYWLEDYALFMALKDKFKGASWAEWERPYRVREEWALTKAREKLADALKFYQFQQYMFWKQWNNLHSYANANGIEMIGDIPIYVAFDSADTWANPKLFQFDEEQQPIALAGCPPDAFAPQGQLWGNPLYDWEYHKKMEYSWWIQRLRHCFQLYDVLRMDHFRAFDEYYAIPYGHKTAENGKWKKGPGHEFFYYVKEKLGDVKIIAEDLGFLTNTVRQLVRDTGYPGMKILQFAFDSRETSNYLPHCYERNCVVYTGTHDNDTTAGWFHMLDARDRQFALDYMGAHQIPEDKMYLEFVRLAMASVGNLCMIPMQDYLGLDSEARMNVPSTVGGNWTWRLKEGQLTEQIEVMIKKMAVLYGRCDEIE